jgi:O-acetyl-ADP-ribose deacetylase (regulator of RNase III)
MKILIGNIFSSKTQTFVNTVNCVGIMGKGIAAEFKKRFPEMYKDYLTRCERKNVKPGIPYLFKNGLFSPQIVNFPTKTHWRAASHIEDIEKGLKILSEKYKEWNIASIAIPPLGCGNGQLLWESVGPLIYKYVSRWDIPVEIYAPYNTPPNQLNINFLSEESNSNEGLIQEQELGRMYRILPGLNYDSARDRYLGDIKKWDDLINKTADLFLRLDTHRAEVVTTVLFIEKEFNKKGDISEQDVFNEVMKWKQKRNPSLDKDDVAETIRNLGVLEWLHLKPSRELPVNQADF